MDKEPDKHTFILKANQGQVNICGNSASF